MMSRRFLLLAGTFVFVSCGSENSDPDCSGSDLSLRVWSSSEALCGQPTGVVELEASGGAGTFTYSINGRDFQEEPIFTGLTAGNYAVTVMDGIGCELVETIVVDLKSIHIEVSVEDQTDAGCGGSEGTITLSATGGEEPYAFNVDGGTFSASPYLESLTAGSHLVEVQDVSGCVATLEVEVLAGTSLQAEVMPIVSSNCAIGGCHGDTQAPLLTSKEAVMANASKIQERTASGAMPPTGKLPDEEIVLISCWVNDGARNN